MRLWQRRTVATKLPFTKEDRASASALYAGKPPNTIVPPAPRTIRDVAKALQPLRQVVMEVGKQAAHQVQVGNRSS
jgi:hypothetical protein